MARSALLNTDTEDLKELLSSGKSYSVAPYQRDYSWKLENWEDLWDDLATVEANREDHHMESIVLETRERKQFRIIDGQQRKATLRAGRNRSGEGRSQFVWKCVDRRRAEGKIPHAMKRPFGKILCSGTLKNPFRQAVPDCNLSR